MSKTTPPPPAATRIVIPAGLPPECGLSLVQAAGDFYTACLGPTATPETPGETRLSWLSALLSDLENDPVYVGNSVDPEAAATALRESRALCDALRTAVRRVEGGEG